MSPINCITTYETATKIVYTYVNGVLVQTVDMVEAAAEISTAVTMSRLNDIRIQFTYNKTFALDDIAAYSASTVPEYENAYILEDGVVNTSRIIVAGSEGKAVSPDGTGAARVYDSSVGSYTDITDSAVVVDGNIVCTEKATAIGNVYKYYHVFDENASAIYKNWENLDYHQGGNPKDEEGNDAGDLRTDVENVHGSGMTMELMSVGVNNNSSRQSYYHTTWNKANSYDYRYLVFEADVAFPSQSGNIYSGYSFNLSTNAGTGIGTHVNSVAENQNRVSHYIWIYDAVEGKYSDYLNGDALAENTEMVEKFRTGAGTAIRFSINGTYEANAADPTKVLSGYVSNIVMYECNKTPEIKQPLRIPGKVHTTLPVTAGETKLSDLLAMFDEADREKVTVYSNRSYVAITDPEEYVPSAGGIIVTEKDGIYDYARISWAPSEGADYAIETLQKYSDGKIYAGVMNYGEERQITPVIVRYDTEGNISGVDYREQTCNKYGAVGVTLEAGDTSAEVELYVWDGISTMKPLGSAIKIR